MSLKDGDFVRINYTGRIKLLNKVFDTTIPEVAEREGVDKEKVKALKPIPVVVNKGFVIRGLDEALIGMEIGETKVIEVPPEKGFGERRAELIEIMPLREFKKRKINPVPGMVVEIGGRPAKIQSVSGGRVRVDFNHELAGKVLEYEVTVVEKIDGMEEKVKAIIEYRANVDPSAVKVTIENDACDIEFEGNAAVSKMMPLKKTIADDIFKYIGGIRKVKYVEIYEKKESEEGSEEKES